MKKHNLARGSSPGRSFYFQLICKYQRIIDSGVMHRDDGETIMSENELPLGILLLAILQVLQALGLMVVGAPWLLLPILGLFIAIPYGISGFFGLFIAFGLFSLQHFAWKWAFILNIIGFVLFLFGGNWYGVILSAIIVVYLNLPYIKKRFE